ncbi:MAG: TolC family protein [Treponema sp.]|jgi:outer membrane protein TolC|nr:TolC family protein [Treponema sp.]
MKLKKRALLALLVLPGAALFAQEALTLTADDAVDYALKNSHQLQSGAIDLEIKKRASDTSWNVFLPTAQVSGTLSRANEVADTMGAMMSGLAPLFQAMQIPIPASAAVEESDRWRAVGGISLSFTFSAAMLESMKASRQSYEAGRITWEQTLKQTERDVRKMFYSLLLMQESLKLQEVSLGSAKTRAEQAEINYRNGRVPQLSLLQAQVAYENQKPQVLKLQQTVDNSLSTFAFLLGMGAGTKIRLEGKIEPAYYDLDAASLIQDNLNSRLDLQSLNWNIAIMNTQLKAINLQSVTPALQLSWNYQPVAAMTALKDGADDPWSDNGGLSLTLAWNLTNLLPWSTQRQQAKDLQANIAKLGLSMGMLTDQARNEITSLVNSLDLSRSQLAAMQANIDLAQRAYDMTAASYRNGTTELLDLRDAENSLNQAKLGLLNEQFTYLSGVLDLEYALNTKLGK